MKDTLFLDERFCSESHVKTRQVPKGTAEVNLLGRFRGKFYYTRIQVLVDMEFTR